ncbi:hypothetical protein AB0B94_30870 [Micromonospora sp. NPDC048986]|uniref:hypothetical protein n=1 Tax=Micromonospora sp. NPDC048986 TaxID=3155644 RepID=UPI0033CC0166
MAGFEGLVEQIEMVAEGIRMDLGDGESPDQLAATASALYRNDPDRAAKLLGAALVLIAQQGVKQGRDWTQSARGADHG